MKENNLPVADVPDLIAFRVLGGVLFALARDLESGAWHRRYADLLALDSCDLGYRLVVGE